MRSIAHFLCSKSID